MSTLDGSAKFLLACGARSQRQLRIVVDTGSGVRQWYVHCFFITPSRLPPRTSFKIFLRLRRITPLHHWHPQLAETPSTSPRTKSLRLSVASAQFFFYLRRASRGTKTGFALHPTYGALVPNRTLRVPQSRLFLAHWLILLHSESLQMSYSRCSRMSCPPLAKTRAYLASSLHSWAQVQVVG